MEQHELKYLSVDLLHPNGWNPQEQDEATFKRLVDEVKSDSTGFIDVVQVVALDDGTYRILGGEHRWLAAKAADLEEIPCIVLTGEKWKDEDLQKFVTVRLNAIKGKVDAEKFLKLYQELSTRYGADAMQGLMGYTDQKAFERLMKSVTKSMKKGMPKEMQAEFEAAAKEAKTIEELQQIVQMMFAKYGDTVKWSFMIFTHGKQEHIMISMDRKMTRAMAKVMEYCRVTETDINKFMEPITNEYMKEATKKLAEVEESNKTSTSDDPLLDEPEPPRKKK